MSERLTDEQLRAVARSFTEQSIEAAAVNEALALRARVAQLEGDYETLACDCEQIRQASDDRAAALRARVARLEAALEDVRIDFEMWHETTSIAKIDAALKDAPQ